MPVATRKQERLGLALMLRTNSALSAAHGTAHGFILETKLERRRGRRHVTTSWRPVARVRRRFSHADRVIVSMSVVSCAAGRGEPVGKVGIATRTDPAAPTAAADLAEVRGAARLCEAIPPSAWCLGGADIELDPRLW
jgi:hypothetical protein